MRALLTLIVVGLLVLSLLAMLRGWRYRARRQSAVMPGFFAVPDSIGEDLLPPLKGVYVGTVDARDWHDRIAVGDVGFRAEATARLTAAGLHVERVGASPLWIPAQTFRGVRSARGLAGKAMGIKGVLVVTWALDENWVLDTGFRGDDRSVYPEWEAALQTMTPNHDPERNSAR
ncbi:transporter [Allokutzneria sp. NRRL B-24872]|uniref:PH-like domain-containing protein n=1 Tax=Allokutzneria sp. NRRL B-24872 TaxID=1137961 RepID=UPI001FEF3EF9|nr:transporter [Allokutzneria sp. NRRL B-24872]